MADFFELKAIAGTYSSADWDPVLHRLADDLCAVQRRWPRQVDFSDLLPGSAVAIFPLLFADALGRIESNALRHFIAGCNLLASAVTVADSLFDEELDRDKRTAFLLCWQGAQYEAMRELGLTFAPESPFWASLQQALAEYLGGVAKEARYCARRRLVRDAAPSECIAIAIAKSCVARVVIVGLGLLGDDPTRTEALLKSLNEYIIARQIFDDVQDWKADVRACRPTLVTARLATVLDRRDEQSSALDLAAAAREFYYGGHAQEFLGLANAHLAVAVELADPLRPLPWHALLARLARAVQELRADLSAIVQRNLDSRAAKVARA